MSCFEPKRESRRAGSVGLVVASLLLCACSDEAVETGPVDAGPAMPEGSLLDWEVDQPGPFHVGYRKWSTSYAAPITGATRTIALHLWYPTLDVEGTPPLYLFADPDVFEGASVAPPADPAGYPVHVYSHGNWGFGATSENLMRWFASHGWVAIAPDHAGDTVADLADAQPISAHYHRPFDVTASLDALEALEASDPLAGKCRTDRVLLSGHSRGSFTAWASGGATFDIDAIQAMCDSGTDFSEPCTPAEIALFEPALGDPRVAVGLPMAGGVGAGPGWFGSGYDAVQKPYMLMSGSDDPVGAENVFARVTAIDFTWLDFVGGCHQLFALGGCPLLDQEEGWPLVDTYALAFARHHILGDASERIGGILDGSEVLSPKVVFNKK